ncbi:hypothetical protein BKA62DRAFT_43583 [Auriculariales sp. MPI-PUGE-AT-0066]|nr:hypothetical protein BKA62DRAFT_43583 [Auriculariales sp. MPI-PUGE-AT-0066]
MQSATDVGGPLRVAIIGAGPAGLALASALALGPKGLHEIAVYEATSTWREVDLDISTIGGSFAIVRALGIEPCLNKIDDPTKGGGENEWTLQYRRSDLSAGHDYYVMHLGMWLQRSAKFASLSLPVIHVGLRW